MMKLTFAFRNFANAPIKDKSSVEIHHSLFVGFGYMFRIESINHQASTIQIAGLL